MKASAISPEHTPPCPTRQEEDAFEGDVLLQLYELLEGQRAQMRIYSHALQQEICFVNPALLAPEAVEEQIPVYTTGELAFVLTLSPEEFRRFHYLKTRLVG